MRHGSSAGHTATDDVDQLVVVELGLAQIGCLARRLRVARAVAGPAVAEAAGRLVLVESLTQTDIAGGRGLRCDRGRERLSDCEGYNDGRDSCHYLFGPAYSCYSLISVL
jgi:hypothetical protein